jgi:hypothetical protein
MDREDISPALCDGLEQIGQDTRPVADFAHDREHGSGEIVVKLLDGILEFIIGTAPDPDLLGRLVDSPGFAR